MSSKNMRGKRKENRSKKHRADRKKNKQKISKCKGSNDYIDLYDLPVHKNNRG